MDEKTQTLIKEIHGMAITSMVKAEEAEKQRDTIFEKIETLQEGTITNTQEIKTQGNRLSALEKVVFKITIIGAIALGGYVGVDRLLEWIL